MKTTVTSDIEFMRLVMTKKSSVISWIDLTGSGLN